ncbi:MAG: transposase [Flavobacteriales bacterium Tduv]
MECSTRRSEFFKSLRTSDLLGKDGKRNKKIYQKGQGIKCQPAYSGISLFTMMLLSHCYDLSDIGTEELVKEFLSCMRFCGFRLEIRSQSIRLYADFEMK